MHKYKLTIEYDGTNYAGWQRQKHSPSIQQAIESAVFAMTGEKAEVIAAGRTDAGVHANGQVAHLQLTNKEFDIFSLQQGLNFYLIKDAIAIIAVEKVDAEFSARFSATKRYYKYFILNRAAPSPLNKFRAWHIFEKLDVVAMQKAADYFAGTHDFSSFRAAACQAKSAVRTLDYIKISTSNEAEGKNNGQGEFIIIEVCGKSFLHNMVRNIVGTLKQVGKGKLDPEKIPEIIAAKDRRAAGICAPAHGLFFEKVEY
jgi:tRNA pseudouridine38-40 synthase